MYTDVVGYSKLTGDDQEVALLILEEHNQILKECTNKYSGNIVKLTGDGLCALFDEPVNGIKCAVDIQIALDSRNQLNTKERQIQIRIGLHYGAYEHKDSDVFGDGVNIAKSIEPIAPHGGIAISDKLNSLVWDQGDIYIREYKYLEVGQDKIKIYQVFLNLITWIKNKNKQKIQILDSQEMYKKAHHFFHSGDYSSAIKFATLAVDSMKENRSEVQSFISHALISIGELNYAQEIIETLRMESLDNLSLQSHIYKMEGHLRLNSKDLNSALESFIESFKIIKSLDSKYVNELVYNICIIFLYKDEKEEISDFLKQIINVKNDQYLILLNGIHILVEDCKNNSKLLKYIDNIQQLENDHMKAFAFKIITLIYMENENYDKAKEIIKKAQKMLKSSSENISDFYQRKFFLEKVYANKDIMEFSHKISEHFVQMTYKEIKEENIDTSVIIESNFCTNCGFENRKKFKFCVSCGNVL